MTRTKITFRLKVLLFMLPLMLPIGSADSSAGTGAAEQAGAAAAMPHAPQTRATSSQNSCVPRAPRGEAVRCTNR